MKYVIFASIFVICYYLRFKRFINPYKLYLVVGKKGSGKSTFLVKQAIRYQKKGYIVYSNMQDIKLSGVRLIDADDLGDFVPVENSCLILDEAGMIYDNREFKKFKASTRDFYKYQRHYKVVCFLASQSDDIDKKLRSLTDEMFLVKNIGIVFSLVRPIVKTVTLTEAISDGESRIAENLKFRFFTSWRFTYIPKYSKYFESFKVPSREELHYIFPSDPVEVKNKKWRKKINMKEKFVLFPCVRSIGICVGKFKDWILAVISAFGKKQ